MMERAAVDLFFAERYNWPPDVVERQSYLRLRHLKQAALALDEVREGQRAAERVAEEAKKAAHAR
jgi:hypothetical protein